MRCRQAWYGLLLWELISAAAACGATAQRIAPFAQTGHSRDGNTRWTITAAALEVFDQRDRRGGVLGRLERFRVELFADETTNCILSGELAELDRQGRLVLRGKVVIESGRDGFQLRTHSLRYLPRTESVATPDKVIITGPTFRAESIGLLIRLPEQTCRLVERVRLTEGRRELKAQTLVWQLDQLGSLGAALQSLPQAYRDGLESILQPPPPHAR